MHSCRKLAKEPEPLRYDDGASSREVTPWATFNRAHVVVSLMPVLWWYMQVQHRLLWVWPEAGSTAHLEAMSTEATVIPDLLHEENTAYAIPWSACSFSCLCNRLFQDAPVK